jgi:PAS domain-containing protein
MSRRRLRDRSLRVTSRASWRDRIGSGATRREGESAFRIRVPVVGEEQGLDWTAVLDAVPNILGVYDSGLRLRYLNKAGRELFGRGLDHIVGRSDAELLRREVTSAY